MPDRPDDETPSTRPHELIEEVGTREQRKVRARQAKDGTLRFGVGMFGVVGWSVALPTLFGILLGVWLDRVWPGRFSWTLALLLAGVTLGCLSAWYWVSYELKGLVGDEKETKR